MKRLKITETTALVISLVYTRRFQGIFKCNFKHFSSNFRLDFVYFLEFVSKQGSCKEEDALISTIADYQNFSKINLLNRI